MVSAGIDFGTSNSSIAIWADSGPRLLPLESGSTLLPTAIYASQREVHLDNAIDEESLQKRVAKAKVAQSRKVREGGEEVRFVKVLGDAELESIERGVMRRELAEQAAKQLANRSLANLALSSSEIWFGEEAIRMHLRNSSSGFFMRSPKPFLGANIAATHAERFKEITAKILSHIKAQAEYETQQPIDNIVLGRPVMFQGTQGEQGNAQAIGLLRGAANAAGFRNVEFLLEPVAAALDFERGLKDESLVLVVDAGGGTTDCSFVRLGPSLSESKDRNHSILGYCGGRFGGTDIDVKLAIRKIMALLGKDSLLRNGLPVPNSVFCDAASVYDVHAQERFLSRKTGGEIRGYVAQSTEAIKLKRLLKVHQNALNYRINRSCELAKIHLSEKDVVNLPLRYIDDGLIVEILRAEFREAIGSELDKIVALMIEATRQAGTSPDMIYVTGGTSRSPVVHERIARAYPSVPIISGDSFGSVTAGLATWARQIF